MIAFFLAWLGSAIPPSAFTGPPEVKVVRAAVEKSLVPIRAGAAGHVDKKTCFACHNQTYPALAFATARSAGVDVPDEILKDQIEHVTSFVTDHLEEYRTGKGTGGQADTAGAILWTLELTGHQPDEATEAVVEYLLATQAGKDHWTASSSTRPPTEVSAFTTTYLAVRGLKTWATAKQKGKANGRIEKAKGWLMKATPTDTEDRVFRLLGLKEVGAKGPEIAAAAFDLLNTQRSDGGWGQLPTMASDAYATGTALVALQAGGLQTDSPTYRAGLRYLLATQRADGSWLVRTRSKAFQPYYESGFPHGKDQFISSAASSWAATALALALPAK